ncbi:hypothetical protein GIB67_004679 [Kingdonia uniflora]|uniref:Formin-like protein n=1 Tax=Kingdonia uniflora TaxID=39325 RepID=A0A7J7P4W2_9MAGN|nr:hypothetical protein GIB67_004679 [Kingdonia uniflora]
MTAMFQSWSSLLLLLFFFSLSNSQNIEVFFPGDPNSYRPIVETSIIPSPPPPTAKTYLPSSSSKSSGRTVTTAVIATAVSTLVIAAVFFFFLQKYCISRGRWKVQNEKTDIVLHPESAVSQDGIKCFDGTLKGLIVDENGLDVLYWRKLEDGKLRTSFNKEVIARKRDGQRKFMPVQEIPLLRGKSSSSQVRPELEEPNRFIALNNPSRNDRVIADVAKSVPPPLPPPPPVPKAPPPPPPPVPILVKKGPAPPPPPPQVGGLASSSRPPTAPKVKLSASKRLESSPSGNSNTREAMAVGQTKLKPLHWDKVTAKADHSMVWDKMSNGSFRFDDDLMEALFGYVATNKKSPDRKNAASNLGNSTSPPAQVFILDPRKSQNTAIVLRSLAISRKEILDALLEGQGLNADTLEKLARVAPTKEEETQILAFEGNPTRLADAESFLYHILKAVPSPFSRIQAMFFRSNYDPEILHLKESLQTLEFGCKDLRTRGLFLKLLEAILKAGNRMNAGTTRGNAQAFNLTALRKLSDVKSTDNKTTLLHFVVEEVVRSEGKRCVLNRNYSLSRNNSSRSNSGFNPNNEKSKEEREKEFMMLGLPVVGGLSVEFSNVKKAATIDYDTLVNASSTLTTRVAEIRKLLGFVIDSNGGGFVMEMKGFLELAEEELKVVKEEQTRVMEIVKRTSEYYQASTSKDKTSNPFQIFGIIKDFLGMVDQVCVDIARNSQKKKSSISVGPSPSTSPVTRFANLPSHFMSDKSSTSSFSDSEDSF